MGLIQQTMNIPFTGLLITVLIFDFNFSRKEKLIYFVRNIYIFMNKTDPRKCFLGFLFYLLLFYS